MIFNFDFNGIAKIKHFYFFSRPMTSYFKLKTREELEKNGRKNTDKIIRYPITG
jgi:hypothetical protein